MPLFHTSLLSRLATRRFRRRPRSRP